MYTNKLNLLEGEYENTQEIITIQIIVYGMNNELCLYIFTFTYFIYKLEIFFENIYLKI